MQPSNQQTHLKHEMQFHTTSYAVYPSHDVPARRAQKNPPAQSNHENTRQTLTGRNCVGCSACAVQELSRSLSTRSDKPKWSETIGAWQLNATWHPALAPTTERTWIEKKSWNQKKVWSLANSNASEFWPICHSNARHCMSGTQELCYTNLKFPD